MTLQKNVNSSRHEAANRTGFLATLAGFLIAACSSLLSFLTAGSQPAWQMVADGILLAILAIILLIASVMVRVGRTRRAALLMIYSVLPGFVIRTALVKGLGIEFGVIVAFIPAVIALLALPSQSASRITLVGLGFGSAIVVMDILWPFYRPEPPVMVALTALVSAILSGFIYLLFIILQIRRFSLYIKLLLGFTSTALVATIAIGALSNQITTNTLSAKANQILLNSADQTARTVDTFILTNLDALRTEAQLSTLQEYLSGLSSGQSFDPDLASRAESILGTLAKRDQLFIESYALVSKRGKVMLDTDAQGVNNNESQYQYFTEPISTGVPYVSPLLISPEGKPTLVFSSPVRNISGEIVGLLRVRYKGEILQRIISQQNGLGGETSFAILLDSNNIILANGASPDEIIKTLTPLPIDEFVDLQKQQLLPGGVSTEELSVNMPVLQQQLETGNSNFLFTQTGEGQSAGALAQLNLAPWKVVFVQNAGIFLAPARNQTRATTLLAAVVVFLAAIISSVIARFWTNPILRLTQTSEQIAQGNLKMRAGIDTQDEIGALATSFNIMTVKLSETIEDLESKVEERTRSVERRAMLLQAAIEVGRNAASLRDRTSLLNQTTRLISQRFGYYHTGIFELDEHGEYAVLRAANSEGGQRMLARGHKLKVGQTGIVGYVTARGQARIALDVGADAVYFDNPDLPKTRSEMALPLIASGRVLGALDVQSDKPNAFAEEDIATLQVMADQIAIALENTRLFEEGQAALEAARRAYGEQSQKSWKRLISTQKTEPGYISLPDNRLSFSTGEISPEFLQAMRTGKPAVANHNMTLYLPVRTRGEAIGAIRLNRSEEGGRWTAKDIETASILCEQLGTALESARLYGESSERAEREAAISDISSKIGASVKIDTILRTTVQELGQALGETEVVIQLGNRTAKGRRRE